MTKKEEVKEEVKDFGSRPEIADVSNTPDLNTLAHNWQSGSPAVDMRDASGSLSGVNTVAALNAKEEETAKKAKAVKLSPEEYKRRTELSVDDPKYVNPSLDHYVSE